jgi:small subunit ribosomal protein S9
MKKNNMPEKKKTKAKKEIKKTKPKKVAKVKKVTAVKKKKTKAKKETKKKKAVKRTKTAAKAKEVKPKKEVAIKEKVKFYPAEGRRKTSIARVRIWPKKSKEFIINNKSLKEYFVMPDLQKIALAPLEKMNIEGKFKVSVIVRGGGLQGQSEAVRHGLARALMLFNPDFRKKLKKAGFLKRDPRMRERKKFGLKRARRAPQWRKR